MTLDDILAHRGKPVVVRVATETPGTFGDLIFASESQNESLAICCAVLECLDSRARSKIKQLGDLKPAQRFLRLPSQDEWIVTRKLCASEGFVLCVNLTDGRKAEFNNSERVQVIDS